jgi:hypothetical protein
MEPFCREKGRMFFTECDLTEVLEVRSKKKIAITEYFTSQKI